MELLIQRLADGLADGMIYGAIALALVLIYRSTGLVNFAQGEMAMFSTFIVWTLARPDLLGLPLIASIGLGAVFGFLLGAGFERLIMRRFKERDHLSQAMVTMGLFLLLNALAAYVFSIQPVSLKSLFPKGSVGIAGASVGYDVLGLVGVFAVLGLALRAMFLHTRMGLAMRAATNNAVSAQLSGINVDRTVMIGWGLAGAMGAVAGALIAPKLFVSPSMMQAALVYAFAAAVLGGLDSALGAIIGGIVMGLTQHLVGGYVVGAELQLASALFVILIVLLVRPQGLFGTVKVERV